MDQDELDNIRAKVEPSLETVMRSQGLDMMFLMMTNIVEASTELLCHGEMAEETARDAFNVPEDHEKNRAQGHRVEEKAVPAYFRGGASGTGAVASYYKKRTKLYIHVSAVRF